MKNLVEKLEESIANLKLSSNNKEFQQRLFDICFQSNNTLLKRKKQKIGLFCYVITGSLDRFKIDLFRTPGRRLSCTLYDTKEKVIYEIGAKLNLLSMNPKVNRYKQMRVENMDSYEKLIRTS